MEELIQISFTSLVLLKIIYEFYYEMYYIYIINKLVMVPRDVRIML